MEDARVTNTDKQDGNQLKEEIRVYIPIIQGGDELSESKKGLDKLNESVEELSKKLEPYLTEYGLGEKKVTPEIKELRAKYSKGKSTKNTQTEEEIRQKMMKRVGDIKDVMSKIESVETAKDAFQLLYHAEDKKVYNEVLPLYDMAKHFVEDSINNLAYESEFFTIRAEHMYANELPTLFVETHISKQEELDRVKKLPQGIMVRLTPKYRSGVVDLKFGKPLMPSKELVRERQHEVDVLTQFLKDKSLKEEPMWVRVLPNKYKQRFRENNVKRLNHAYRKVENLKKEIRILNINSYVNVNTEEVRVKREAILEDLTLYIQEVNQTLGIDLKVTMTVHEVSSGYGLII